MTNNKLYGGNIKTSLYNTSVEISRVLAHYYFTVIFIISIIIIIIGIIIITTNSLTSTGNAIVTAASCNVSNINSNTPCIATIQFVDASGNQQFANIEGNYIVGQQIQINYNPKYPTNLSAGKYMYKRTIGIIMIVIGALILIIVSIWYLLIIKYKLKTIE
jgi:hypothetical protein